MSTSVSSRIRRAAGALLSAALLTSLSASSANAQLLLRVPGDSPGVPAYARVERPFVFHTDQWAAIIFYRDPGCVPGGFNLLDFFDFPAAFGCPLTVSGFEIWENGPGIDGAPRKVVSSGQAVPVWFVLWSDLQSVLTDDVLTISELNSLGPLKGVATIFHEVLHPLGAVKTPHLTISASGKLPDGRTFQYEFNNVAPAAVTVLDVRITFR
jgi:hypothetical protein